MDVSTSGCEGRDCEQHFHAQDPVFAPSTGMRRQSAAAVPSEQRSSSTEGQMSISNEKDIAVDEANPSSSAPEHGLDERGFRRIIRNFTPS